MSAEPSVQGPKRPLPFTDLEFALRDPAFLPHLLPYNRTRGTRFADCRHRYAPVDLSRLALLLEVCGYDTRVSDVLEMRGAYGKWLPAPHVLSCAPVPVLALLRYVCERDWPARTMNPNDERLKRVFAPPVSPPEWPARPEQIPEPDAEDEPEGISQEAAGLSGSSQQQQGDEEQETRPDATKQVASASPNAPTLDAVPTYTLTSDGFRSGWSLTRDETGEVVMRFPSKEHATRSGALEHALANEGGLVTIRKADGTFSEKRTFPRSTAPRRQRD